MNKQDLVAKVAELAGMTTFLLRWQGEELLLRGYRTFREFQAVITTLTSGKLIGAAPEKSADELLRFLRKSGRAAPVELMAVFDLSAQELNDLLGSRELESSVRFVPVGNGGFWEVHAGALACEASSHVCMPAMPGCLQNAAGNGWRSRPCSSPPARRSC